MEGLYTEIVATIGIIVAASITAYGQWKTSKLNKVLKQRDENLRKSEDVIAAKDAAMKMLTSFERQDKLREACDDLKMSTPIDRVLGFYAVNGLYKPNRASMFFNSVDYEYKHLLGDYHFYSIDETYQAHLKAAELNGYDFIDVAALPPHDMMKAVYASEHVKYSIWMVAGKIEMQNGRVMVLYFSFSTHDNETLDNPRTVEKCKQFISQIELIINEQIIKEFPDAVA